MAARLDVDLDLLELRFAGARLIEPQAVGAGNGVLRTEALGSPCAPEPSWRGGGGARGSTLMTRTDLRILFEIPDCWTPEQALAVYELLDRLRDLLLSRYEAQIMDVLQQERAPSSPPEGSSDPSLDRDF